MGVADRGTPGQLQDTVYATNIDTKKTRRVFVFPKDFKASITTLNADETELGGAWSTDAEKEISKKYPEKHDYFTRIYEAKLPRTLFSVNVKSAVTPALRQVPVT